MYACGRGERGEMRQPLIFGLFISKNWFFMPPWSWVVEHIASKRERENAYAKGIHV